MAGTYVVTGSASGMGRAIVARLQSEGKRVITVDLHDADVVADLSTVQGRTEASRKVLVLSGGLLEGAVMAAGLGPRPGKEFVRLIAQVNYFGVVELLNAWHDALAAGKAKVVVIGSNSTTATPLVPRTAVRAFLHGDARTAIGAVRIFGKAAPSMIYAASKIAVTRWVRRSATAARWVDEGIRMNVLAPGAIMTPLLEKQLSTPEERRNIEAFPLPVRQTGSGYSSSNYSNSGYSSGTTSRRSSGTSGSSSSRSSGSSSHTSGGSTHSSGGSTGGNNTFNGSGDICVAGVGGKWDQSFTNCN